LYGKKENKRVAEIKKDRDNIPVPQKTISPMITAFETICLEQAEWQQYREQLAEAKQLSGMIWIALQMGLWMARQLLEQELGQRAAQATHWGNCSTCGTRLHSKGWQARSLETIVGKIG
jgi:hypothetical protein